MLTLNMTSCSERDEDFVVLPRARTLRWRWSRVSRAPRTPSTSHDAQVRMVFRCSHVFSTTTHTMSVDALTRSSALMRDRHRRLTNHRAHFVGSHRPAARSIGIPHELRRCLLDGLASTVCMTTRSDAFHAAAADPAAANCSQTSIYASNTFQSIKAACRIALSVCSG